jgi:O-antigen/teichoic acid export membrane protein
MLLAATFAINSGINFVMGLLIARFLGPEQFGLYALGAALLVLVNVFAIDWLKLSTIRFYTNAKRHSEPEVRATLDGLAALCTLALIVPLLVAVAAGVDFRVPTAIATAAVAAGVIGGLFDYQQAVARARENDVVYIRMVLVKNLLAIVLMVGGAWWTQDPALVLTGAAISALAALVAVRRPLADAPLALSRIDGAQVRLFAAYAVPLVATNVLLSAIPLVNRAFMASHHGLAEAGYFALASDIGVKLMGTLGATLEIMLLPLAVRALDREGLAASHRQIARNLAVVLAVVLPVALGLVLALPAIEALIVPAAFRGHFSTYLLLMLPAFAAMPIMQVGFNPVFLMSRRTTVSTLAALAGLVINLIAIGLLMAGFGQGAGPAAVALAMTAGFVITALIVAAGAMRHDAARPRWRDLAFIALGLVLMGAAILPLRAIEPAALTLALQVIVGIAVHAGVMLAGDVAGCRGALSDYLQSRKLKAAA